MKLLPQGSNQDLFNNTLRRCSNHSHLINFTAAVCFFIHNQKLSFSHAKLLTWVRTPGCLITLPLLFNKTFALVSNPSLFNKTLPLVSNPSLFNKTLPLGSNPSLFNKTLPLGSNHSVLNRFTPLRHRLVYQEGRQHKRV